MSELLRPFWLMRALYQTIAHPRGGYISTKLFIPRDVWRVKGVKLKAVEEKIANLDYLSAALLKLSKVYTFDADAVLEEMQSLEAILDQVQAVLAKKLSNEVGVQSSIALFKEAPSSDNTSPNNEPLIVKTPNTTSKGSTFSWRRLRSKNSAVGLTTTYANQNAMRDSGGNSNSNNANAAVNSSTVPMTNTPMARFGKRDILNVQVLGPNANYMAALAKLFDAAQVIGMFCVIMI